MRRKQWQKRKCEVKGGFLSVAHNDVRKIAFLNNYEFFSSLVWIVVWALMCSEYGFNSWMILKIWNNFLDDNDYYYYDAVSLLYSTCACSHLQETKSPVKLNLLTCQAKVCHSILMQSTGSFLKILDLEWRLVFCSADGPWWQEMLRSGVKYVHLSPQLILKTVRWNNTILFCLLKNFGRIIFKPKRNTRKTFGCQSSWTVKSRSYNRLLAVTLPRTEVIQPISVKYETRWLNKCRSYQETIVVVIVTLKKQVGCFPRNLLPSAVPCISLFDYRPHMAQHKLWSTDMHRMLRCTSRTGSSCFTSSVFDVGPFGNRTAVAGSFNDQPSLQPDFWKQCQ